MIGKDIEKSRYVLTRFYSSVHLASLRKAMKIQGE